MTTRRLAILALLVLAGAAAFLLRRGEVRGRGGEEAPAAEEPIVTATIRGTVTKPDGPIWILPVRAIVGETVVAEVGTDPNGRYRIEVPAGQDILLEFDPDPAIGLKRVTRRFRLAPGSEMVEDVRLEIWAFASGQVEGLPPGESVTLLAIRDEEFPALPSDPFLAAQALDAVPSAKAGTSGKFRFRRLEAGVTYRLAADGVVWAVRDVVRFKAFDDAVVAKLDLVVPVSVQATDLDTRAPVPVFAVRLVDDICGVLATVHGRNGAAERTPLPPVGPRPSEAERWWRAEAASFLGRRTFVAEAEGYHAQEFRFPETAVALVPVREPNVVLAVVHADGKPYDGDLALRFGKDLRHRPHVIREPAGRFRASLPAGTWRARIERPGVLLDAKPEFDIVVPAGGTAEPPPIVIERTGTVTFEGLWQFYVQRLPEGKAAWCKEGTRELPVGSYRIYLHRGNVTFEVLAGRNDTVRLAR